MQLHARATPSGSARAKKWEEASLEGSSRIAIYFDGISDSQGRIEVSAAAIRPPMGLGELTYEDEAIVPIQKWRPITSDERRDWVSNVPPTYFGGGISVIRLTDSLVEPFKSLRELAAEARREQELFPLIRGATCTEGVKAFAAHVKQQFGSVQPNSDVESGKIIGGIYVRPPGLPTVTVQPGTNRLIGLHLDDWYSFPLARKHLAPNRICVNLGSEDRFFLFLNLPVTQIYRAVKRHVNIHAESGGTFTGRTFIALFPCWPVLRLRIHPGEAYIAPTENIIHDGSTSQMSTMDITMSIRGRFELFRPSC